MDYFVNRPILPPVQAKEQVLTRLHKDVYRQLAAGMPINGCPKSELEAGFMCGVQHVLTKLREGFVVETAE